MVIKIAPKWLIPFGYGLTLWKLVLVRKDSEDIPYVTAHEACHVRQWTELGFFTFLYQYFKELIHVGYTTNKFEVEARAYGIANRYKYA